MQLLLPVAVQSAGVNGVRKKQAGSRELSVASEPRLSYGYHLLRNLGQLQSSVLTLTGAAYAAQHACTLCIPLYLTCCEVLLGARLR
jgi:hypothetical protein